MTNYFTKKEWLLLCTSWGLIAGAFLAFDRVNVLTLIASLIGTVSLLFAAKGHPVSQLLMIVFSLLYGYISWGFCYYGEMLTYMGMTMPMAVYAFVMWMRHPSAQGHSQAETAVLTGKEKCLAVLLTAAVTAVFFPILRHFHTANLIPSTLSVTTSFLAVFLTARRSPFFALAYAANDLVLILLWTLAAREDVRYLSVLICFSVFLVNDLYGFVCWRRRAAAKEAA